MKLNRKNVLAVADAIERRTVPGLGFDMEFYMTMATEDDRGCGTTACIAGWCAVLAGKTKATRVLGAETIVLKKTHVFGGYHEIARKYLGIDEKQAVELFHTHTDKKAKAAVATLRRLADTGEVQWKKPKSGSSKTQ